MDTDIILQPGNTQKLISVKNPISMDDISVQQPRRRRFPIKKNKGTVNTRPILSSVNRSFKQRPQSSSMVVGGKSNPGYDSGGSDVSSSDSSEDQGVPESDDSLSENGSDQAGAVGGGGVNLDLLSNPSKKLCVPAAGSVSDSDSESQASTFVSVSPAQNSHNNGESPQREGGTGMGWNDMQNSSLPQSQEAYRTMQNQKHEYLYKLYRLEQKGIKYNKKLSMKSSLEELRSEYDKVVRDIDVDSSIKFQRRVLMAIVSTLEFGNKKFDPFDLKLDGWSENVMDDVDNYDSVFERMHDKYKTRAQMAPEVELLMSIAGSAFMFHLTNSLFKSAMPNMGDIMKQNPELMQNISQAMANNVKSNNNVTPGGNTQSTNQADGNLSSMMNDMFSNMKDPEEEERLNRVGTTHKNFADNVGSLPMPRSGGGADRFTDLGSVASSEDGSDSEFDVRNVSYPVQNKKGVNSVTLKL